MVGVDDRQVRLQRRRGRPLREPRPQLGVVATSEAAIFTLCIANLSHFHPFAKHSSFSRQRESKGRRLVARSWTPASARVTSKPFGVGSLEKIGPCRNGLITQVSASTSGDEHACTIRDASRP